MSLRHGLHLMAIASLLALSMMTGCSKEAPAAPPTAPAETPAAAPPSAAVEVVSALPADALAVVVFRSPQTFVDQLNDFAGPELSSLPALGLSYLPVGAFDMDGPVALCVMLENEEPSAVFLMRVKDADKLSTVPPEGGILQLHSAIPELYAVRTGPWAAFGSLEDVKNFQQRASAPRLTPDEPMAQRINDNLIWAYLRAKPLTDLATAELKEAKAHLVARNTARAKALGDEAPEKPSKEIQALEWLENLLLQMESAEVGLNFDSEHLLVQGGLTLSENGSLLTLARTLKPIESYEGTLPETDRLLAASWIAFDCEKAAPEIKNFLRPLMDLVFEKLGEAVAEAPTDGPPSNPLATLHKALDAQWRLLDEYPGVVGDRAASLMEVPERGQGMYRLTQTLDLKDGARFNALTEKGLQTSGDFTTAIANLISGSAGISPFKIQSKAATETLEGLSVDTLRFDIRLEPSPYSSSSLPSDLTTILYGPEGLAMHRTVCDNRGLATLGGADVMTRAIQHARGKVGDLARQKAVAAALKRVPAGSSAVCLFSFPAYACLADTLADDILLSMMSPDHREAAKQVPLPQIAYPTTLPPTVVSLRLDGRMLRLDMDMPTSEVTQAIPYVRHMYGRIIFYAAQLGMDRAIGLHPATRYRGATRRTPPHMEDIPLEESPSSF